MKRLVRPAIGAGLLLALAATPAAVPGEHNQIAVAGTPAADALCSAGIAND